MRRTAVAILALALVASGVAQERRLDDGRQWLEAGASARAETEPIRRAAMAAAFNDVATAEPALHDIIRSRAGTDPASHAHELLSRIYLRSGRYAQLIANLDAWAAAFPDRPEVKNERADVEQFRGLPDQINSPKRSVSLRHDAGDFAVPVTINGKAATYLLDTGAWISAISAPEAVRLGLAIRTGSGSIGDASGKGVKVRTAVAKEIAIGEMRFRDVSFVVLPNQEPWTSMPVGRGGILGVPIILGLGRVEWSSDGSWRLAAAPDAATRPARNVAFSGNHLILDMRVAGTQVFGALDIGAAQPALRPAHVTLQRIAAMGGNCCIGNLGLDLLTQTGVLTMDFGAMTLCLASAR